MMVIELCWFAFRIACFLYLQLMTSSRVKHAQELRLAAATNNVAREQDNSSKEKAKTMVEELQCKSLTAPESDTVQQDWAAHRATWLDETSNALPHHRKGERGQRKKDGLAPNASDSDADDLNGSETRIPIAC